MLLGVHGQQWKINGRWMNHTEVLAWKKKQKQLKENAVDETKIKTKSETKPELPTNFFALKKLAKDKGMKVDNKTSKDDIITFLTT